MGYRLRLFSMHAVYAVLTISQKVWYHTERFPEELRTVRKWETSRHHAIQFETGLAQDACVNASLLEDQCNVRMTFLPIQRLPR